MPQYYLKKSYSENLSLCSKPMLASGSILYSKKLITILASLCVYDCACIELSSFEAKIFKLLNGRRSIEEIASILDFKNELVLQSISAWENSCPGIFTYPEDLNFLKRAKFADVAASLIKRADGEKILTRKKELTEYHQKGMSGRAHEQFEHVETTVSHLYRKPREALRGKTFGEALADKFFAKGFFEKIVLKNEPMEVLEVGAGTGILTKAFLERLRSLGFFEKISYTIIDPSPNLLISQKNQLANFKNVSFIEKPIEENRFSENSFDLILSNEVIADFSVGRVFKNSSSQQIEKLPEDLKAEVLKEKYMLETKSKIELLNTGAIEFLEQISTLLKNDGNAFISEYGGLDKPPVQLTLDGHNEHSIHFNHLVKTAKELGLSVDVFALDDYLGFDQSISILCDLSFGVLNEKLLPRLGVNKLERKAYSKNELKSELGDLVDSISNLKFNKIDCRNNLGPALFYVLELNK